jgi:hypothetical protein
MRFPGPPGPGLAYARRGSSYSSRMCQTNNGDQMEDTHKVIDLHADRKSIGERLAALESQVRQILKRLNGDQIRNDQSKGDSGSNGERKD